MAKLKKNNIVAISCIVILVVILGLLFWLYTGKITSTKKILYKVSYLPAALINLHPVPISALTGRYDLLKTVKNGGINLSDVQIKDLILDKIVADKELQYLAAERGVKVSNEQITALYNQMAAELSGGDEGQLEKTISNYAGLNKKTFQNEVLQSYLLEKGLKTWYYGQKNLNAPLYQTAENIVSTSKSGGEFGELAQKYSQDEATAVFEGDSGFIEASQLSPEITKALENAKSNEVRQVAGDDGLHIIKILGRDTEGQNGAERIRLQHIFLQGKGYDAWLGQTTKQFKVTKFTKNLSF